MVKKTLTLVSSLAVDIFCWPQMTVGDNPKKLGSPVSMELIGFCNSRSQVIAHKYQKEGG